MSTDPPPSAANEMNSRESGGDIVARAGRYYRNTRYLMCLMLIVMGCWFLYDGFVKYPRENEIVNRLKVEGEDARRRSDQAAQTRVATQLKEHTEHTNTDVLWQKILGFALPPIGLLVLFWSMHRSRGEYRLSGTRLSVPGHPTVDLDDVKSVNDEMWDRKGILFLDYEKDGQQGQIVLDDFIYDRPPTDAIYERIADKFGLGGDDADSDEEEEDEGEDESEIDDTASADRSDR